MCKHDVVSQVSRSKRLRMIMRRDRVQHRRNQYVVNTQYVDVNHSRGGYPNINIETHCSAL